MLHSWSQWDEDSGFDFMLTQATRALSLFQHHDGVTGTAKDHVMKDYAKQMNEALILCKNIIQQSVYRYLTQPSVSYLNKKQNFQFKSMFVFKDLRA